MSQGRAWLGGLIKASIVRQFLHDGHLYKEEEEQSISHFELFADLVFVALVHVSGIRSYCFEVYFDLLAQVLGEVAAEEATMWNALKFILMLWPPWSIWTDMRSYLNVVCLF